MNTNAAAWSGERIRQLRVRLGLTQAGMAARLMVTQPLISLLESGQHVATPRVGLMLQLLERKKLPKC